MNTLLCMWKWIYMTGWGVEIGRIRTCPVGCCHIDMMAVEFSFKKINCADDMYLIRIIRLWSISLFTKRYRSQGTLWRLARSHQCMFWMIEFLPENYIYIDTSCSVGNVKYTSEKIPSLICKPIWREEIWQFMGRKLLPPT